MRAYFLVCCTVFLFSGCCANKVGEEVAEGLVNELGGGAELFVVVLIYENKNNRWPDSIEELETFCSEAKGNCLDLNWSEYKNANFQKLPKGKLEIKLNRTHEHGESSFNAILEAPKAQ